MSAPSHRPVLADFDLVLDAPRILRMRAAYRWLFAAFLAVAVLSVVGLLVSLLVAPVWFASSGVGVFVAVSVGAFVLAVVGMGFVGATARADRAAESFVQQAFVEDIEFAYGLTVPARRIPLEVGAVSQADVLIDGEPRMVALVLPGMGEPIVVIPVKSERPLLPLRAVASV